MEDLGFSGTGSRSNSRFEAGSPIQAKQLNDLAAGLQTGQPMPYLGEGPVVSFTPGGSLITGLSGNAVGGGTIQQFQIYAQTYKIDGVIVPDVTALRVVKGEVVWSPKLPTEDILPSNTCTTQTTVETWFDLPTWPIFDDGDEIYIGNGGIVIPNVAGVEIGIFIFKPTMLPADVDPIIVALADYSPACPVVLPFTPPVEGAVWEVVKIGSMVYVEPDPEADPPVRGGWQITQNFIGSMTLPGGGSNSGTAPFHPPQLPSTAIAKAGPMPFECRIDVDSSGDMLLKVGKGSVSYTKSNMPWIQLGSISNKYQTEYASIQAVPSGWRKAGTIADGWMETGGGYKISGEGQWYLCAVYWDATAGGDFNLPAPLQNERPFLALIDAYGSDVDKLFVETGPGLYTQTMNIQPMDGYNASQTELAGDWMHCHSTWFNPMKLGYDIKMIARIESTSANPSEAQVITYQAASVTQNEIQNIYFSILPKDGFVIFTYDGAPSAPFYPAPWAGANNATNLFTALQAIPALVGNITVTRTSEKNFYVTFINNLQSVDVSTLVPVNGGLESWDYDYVIDQYVVGNLVMDTEPKFNGTQIMNKKDVTEAEDPYTVQAAANPAFPDLTNRDDIMSCTGLSGDTDFNSNIYPVISATVPRTVTDHPQSYLEADGCTPGDVCEHPFQVHKASEAEGTATYTVCEGMVNNIIPSNITDTFNVTIGDETYIWVAVGVLDGTPPTFPDPDNVTLDSGAAVPTDSDEYGYIAIAHIQTDGTVSQLVNGSVWASRIKIGDDTANYYYAGV